MPPAALMSATACSAPFLDLRAERGVGPVIGPATPSLICAVAAPASASLRPNDTPGQAIFFMLVSLSMVHEAMAIHRGGDRPAMANLNA